jgi:DNA-binding transcriptional MerR regulator
MTSATFTISDLAHEFDLTTRAIRFYEDMGLLSPKRVGASGRSRVYSPRDRTRLKLTLRAKRLGFSLSEAKDIIDAYESPRDTALQMQKFVDVLATHRFELEGQMAELQAQLEEIKAHEKEARAALLLARGGGALAGPALDSVAKKAAKSVAKTANKAATKPVTKPATKPATHSKPA